MGLHNKLEDELPKGQADPTLRDQFLFRDLMFPVLLHRPLHDDEGSVLEGEPVRIDQRLRRRRRSARRVGHVTVVVVIVFDGSDTTCRGRWWW